MFADACTLIDPFVADIGWSPAAKPDGFNFAGFGCHISPTEVITALHVLTELRENGLDPIIWSDFGAFELGQVREFAASDIAVITVGKTVQPAESNPEKSLPFPVVSTEELRRGMAVGRFSRLIVKEAPASDPENARVAFFEGFLSFKMRELLRWALSGGLAQNRFSGSPVFRPDGRLAGILVAGLEFNADTEKEHPHLMPFISPLLPIAKDISKIVPGFLTEEL